MIFAKRRGGNALSRLYAMRGRDQTAPRRPRQTSRWESPARWRSRRSAARTRTQLLKQMAGDQRQAEKNQPAADGALRQIPLHRQVLLYMLTFFILEILLLTARSEEGSLRDESPGNSHSRAASGTPCESRRSVSLFRPQGVLDSSPLRQVWAAAQRSNHAGENAVSEQAARQPTIETGAICKARI